jgi:hypothetical protein
LVKGLSIFQEWFSRFEEQYVLIGGTAVEKKENIYPNGLFIGYE